MKRIIVNGKESGDTNKKKSGFFVEGLLIFVLLFTAALCWFIFLGGG